MAGLDGRNLSNKAKIGPKTAAKRKRLKGLDGIKRKRSALSVPKKNKNKELDQNPLAVAGKKQSSQSKISSMAALSVSKMGKLIRNFFKKYLKFLLPTCCPCACGCIIFIVIITVAFIQALFVGLGYVASHRGMKILINNKGQAVFSQANLDKSQLNLGGLGANVEAIADALGIDLNNASLAEIYTVMRVAAEGGGNFASLVANDVGALGGGVGGWRGVNLFNVLKEIYSQDPNAFYNAAVQNGGKVSADWLVNELNTTDGRHWESMTLSGSQAHVVDANVRADAVGMFNAIQGALSTEVSRTTQLAIMEREFGQSVARAKSRGITNPHDQLLYADMDVNYGPGWVNYSWAQNIFSQHSAGADNFQSLVRTYEWREHGAAAQGLDYSGRLNGIVHPLVDKVRQAKKSSKSSYILPINEIFIEIRKGDLIYAI